MFVVYWLLTGSGEGQTSTVRVEPLRRRAGRVVVIVVVVVVGGGVVVVKVREGGGEYGRRGGGRGPGLRLAHPARLQWYHSLQRGQL